MKLQRERNALRTFLPTTPSPNSRRRYRTHRPSTRFGARNTSVDPNMHTLFTRSGLRRSGRKTVCEFLQTSTGTVSNLRFAHTAKLPSTTTSSKPFRNTNRSACSNWNVYSTWHSAWNGGSFVFIATSISIIGWVSP